MDTILWEQESDNYTKRSLSGLKEEQFYNFPANDEVLKNTFENLNKFHNSPKKILDIGCSFGITINFLKKRYSESILFGIDPGEESISIAKKNLADNRTHFFKGFSHELPFEDDFFDVIFISMVLQWLPRKYIIRTISEIDRVLKVGGIVYIDEFLPNNPLMSKSIHNDKIYIFKEEYSKFFTAYPWYKEVFKEVKFLDDENQQRVAFMIKKYEIKDVYKLKNSVQEKKND